MTGSAAAAGIRTIRYKSWTQFKSSLFKELAGQDPFPLDRYLFRGHADSEWRLESSFDRLFPDVEDREPVFQRMLETFRDGCDDEVPDGVTTDKERLVALAQHSGLPTRLLDWSESPYVAAFFAFGPRIMGYSASRDIAIWVLDTTTETWDGSHGVDLVQVRSGANIRMRNQSGHFTLSSGPERTLEELVENAGSDKPALTQLLLPASDAPTALKDLALMGMNHARLMPGLTGVAQTAYMKTVLEQSDIDPSMLH